jgi:hypothetical protein
MTDQEILAQCARDIAEMQRTEQENLEAAKRDMLSGADVIDVIERMFVARMRIAMAPELITDDYRILYGTRLFPSE